MWRVNALPCAGLLGEVASLDVDVSTALEEEALLIGVELRVARRRLDLLGFVGINEVAPTPCLHWVRELGLLCLVLSVLSRVGQAWITS